ncbi:MAG: redoxin domain-containing protein [Muribaculaceae bacterium]|nr:redoxin domain-containing protein [Muribaculaceae bacterium]
MKRILFAFLLALAAMSVNAQQRVDNPDTVYTVRSIDQDRFKDVIADWGATDWNMVSPRPVVVDFYADWCMPCRRLAPILRDVAQYYHGEVDFYRINVDDNPDIASAFEVRSIPMLLICPLQGDPKSLVGLYTMQEYIRFIDQALKK